MTTLLPAQYEALVEQAPSLIWRVGLAGQHDYFNAGWLAFTGRALDVQLGTGWATSVHPGDVDACLAAQRDHFARRLGFELEYRLRRHDGVYRTVLDRGVPYAEATGEFGGFIGNCVDIDDRRARDASFGVNDFFEMSLDNLCVVGFDGYFKRVNPSWTRTLGWTAEELLSRPSEDFLHPEDRAKTLSGRARLHGGTSLGSLTNRYRCRDGSYRFFEWRSVAHADRGLVYAAARDITEQMRAAESLSEAKAVQETLQRQLVLADRMASVGTLAAGVAHEINNPLSYVLGNLSLIIEDLASHGVASELPRAGQLLELATAGQEGAERIRKIVRGLKTFSRADEERRHVLDVRQLLEQSVDMTFNEIRHRARLIKDYGAIPAVEADDARLGQVFINLLVNAAQAIPEGDSAGNEIRIVTATHADGQALIEIQDTGVGIAPHQLARIFDPFFTTKPVGVGTGLGLAICHNIVTALGGTLSVESELGRGTLFRVMLPAATARATVEKVAQPVGERTLGARAAVLIVDDEPSVGVVLGRVLREHHVTVVTSARQALALIGSGKRFDVIISDLMMPEMSGMDFYDELARRDPELARRVVFVSGGAFTAAADAFLDRVSNARVEKPFHPPSMRALVQGFLR